MRYVAFLRAINVTNRFVKMADLRQMLAGLDGLANIETFIQSGNVLFDAPSSSASAALESAIEAHLQERLGFPVPTFARSAAEMNEIAARWPFAEEEQNSKVNGYVAFLRAAPPPELQARLEDLSGAVDVLRAAGSHLYWLYYPGRGKTGVSHTLVEKNLQSEITVRNITTVRKLAAMLSAGE
jgi:uncharacterized protein (DUF1697 family)